MKEEKIRKMVREGYGKIATKADSCCTPASSCCGETPAHREISRKVGYSEEELNAVPPGANLGLGCGNPTALASLKEGETVLDLGSGAGLDCFLAARKVGEKGKVVGVDMTAEMIDKARENARKTGYENVEFRLGEIENLPAADESFDIVISNCVINLSPDKEKVFEEAYRVLKPGGRLLVSDIVLQEELPARIRESAQAYLGCVAGAIMKDDYLEKIRAAGFEEVEVLDSTGFSLQNVTADPTASQIVQALKLSQHEINGLENSIASIKVRGRKPGNGEK
ncbi:MAG: arsenite methyltransferase [Candidatus Glassbacteria bacterium]